MSLPKINWTVVLAVVIGLVIWHFVSGYFFSANDAEESGFAGGSQFAGPFKRAA